MAIARGAGTEIIRTGYWNYNTANTDIKKLIIGVQHHIYTVLSFVMMNHNAVGTANVGCTVSLFGMELDGGNPAQTIKLFNVGALDGQKTYVWNDKFSFNGCEPSALTGALSTEAEQDLVVDQGTTTAQILQMQKGHNDDNWSCCITYIDQNNA